MNNTEAVNRVDTRRLKNGRMRLRFKLSREAIETVNTALNIATKMAGYKYSHSALEAMAMSFMSFEKFEIGSMVSSQGSNRFLVKFYPDQYELFTLALNDAREYVETDADALVMMCLNFIRNESLNDG